jgi:hypothetical protein
VTKRGLPSALPGGTDLRMGSSVSETRLTGPFMNLIQAGVTISYFVTERSAVYTGPNAQLISNAGLVLSGMIGVLLGCRGISRGRQQSASRPCGDHERLIRRI